MTCHAAQHFDPHKGNGYLVWTPYSETFIEALKRTVDAGRRRWVGASRAWFVAAPLLPDVRALVRRHFGADVVFSLPPGATQNGRQGTNEAPREPRDARRARALSEAYAALHVAPDAPEAVVRAAHRALAFALHPDRGGSTARMQTVNAALDTILGGAR